MKGNSSHPDHIRKPGILAGLLFLSVKEGGGIKKQITFERKVAIEALIIGEKLQKNIENSGEKL